MGKNKIVPKLSPPIVLGEVIDFEEAKKIAERQSTPYPRRRSSTKSSEKEKMFNKINNQV
jgi:hypothetical protein